MPERTRLTIRWKAPVFGREEFYAARNYFSDPAVPVRVFRAGHTGTVTHGHDFVELALVTGGSTRYEFCSASGERRGCELMAGDLIGLAPGDRHRYSEGEAFSLCNVLFQPEFLGESWPVLRNLEGMKRLFRGESIHLHPADANGRRLPENDLFYPRDVFFVADHIHLPCRTILLHKHRVIMHIPGACLKEQFHHIAKHLTGTVVNIGFQLPDDVFRVGNVLTVHSSL